jgi:hypothetical protein
MKHERAGLGKRTKEIIEDCLGLPYDQIVAMDGLDMGRHVEQIIGQKLSIPEGAVTDDGIPIVDDAKVLRWLHDD